MDNSISFLIDSTIKILKCLEYEWSKAGKKFNIFQITGCDSKEVIICRVLCELLNPKGSHGQGDLFLQKFISEVLHYDVSEFDKKEFDKADVKKEVKIDEQRRVDIVINIGNKVFPLEVKIFADDQPKQCFDYYNFFKNQYSKVKLYYLTLDGHLPSIESSVILLEHEHYECLSFQKDIYDWINGCLNELINNIGLKEILEQFKDAIGGISGRTEREVISKVSMLIKSSESYKAAVAIQDSLNEVRILKMKELFDSLRISLEEKGYYGWVNNYEDETEHYYSRGTKQLPKISLLIPLENEEFSIKLEFVIEIEQRLYYGIRMAGDTKESVNKYVKDEMTPKDAVIDPPYWYWWKYADDKTDYKYFTGSYDSLYDEDKFKEYIIKVVEIIDQDIKMLIK